MNEINRLCVKLIHCGNKNICTPDDHSQKNIFYMPMGLFPLARRLQENGVDVEIIHLDLVVEKGEAIASVIDIINLDAEGFDCHWANQSLVVIEAAQLLKKKKPGLFIFLGGFRRLAIILTY